MGRDGVSSRAVERVLAGDGCFDLLAGPDQAVVLDVWAERMAAMRGDLDYATAFAADGESYSEADAEGNVVIRRPGSL